MKFLSQCIHRCNCKGLISNRLYYLSNNNQTSYCKRLIRQIISKCCKLIRKLKQTNKLSNKRIHYYNYNKTNNSSNINNNKFNNSSNSNNNGKNGNNNINSRTTRKCMKESRCNMVRKITNNSTTFNLKGVAYLEKAIIIL